MQSSVILEQGFNSIKTDEITDNPFKLIGEDWMLITAGTLGSYNTMTASWGGLGVLWGKKIAFCVIRPHRHTFKFIEKAGSFTLSFFEERYKNALEICGTKSGRDIDKASVTGLTPVSGTLPETVFFAEARLVLECKKLYFQDLNPEHFLDPAIHECYPSKDYHRMYVGEVLNCLAK